MRNPSDQDQDDQDNASDIARQGTQATMDGSRKVQDSPPSGDDLQATDPIIINR